MENIFGESTPTKISEKNIFLIPNILHLNQDKTNYDIHYF